MDCAGHAAESSVSRTRLGPTRSTRSRTSGQPDANQSDDRAPRLLVVLTLLIAWIGLWMAFGQHEAEMAIYPAAHAGDEVTPTPL